MQEYSAGESTSCCLSRSSSPGDNDAARKARSGQGEAHTIVCRFLNENFNVDFFAKESNCSKEFHSHTALDVQCLANVSMPFELINHRSYCI